MKGYSGRIKKILKEKELSVADFCRIIGLNSPTTIHLLIKENRKPSGKTVERIITAFPDISEKWLLYGKEEDKQSKEEDRTVTAQQVIEFIEFDLPGKIDQRDNHAALPILDKLDEIADMFMVKTDSIEDLANSNETEMLKLKETVLIMHKNAKEITDKINYLVNELNKYLNEK